jgi:hypothetical protein
LKEKYWLRSRKLRLTTVGDPPCSPRDTPLSTKVGTKFRQQVAVVQSVYFVCGLKATEFVFQRTQLWFVVTGCAPERCFSRGPQVQTATVARIVMTRNKHSRGSPARQGQLGCITIHMYKSSVKTTSVAFFGASSREMRAFIKSRGKSAKK